MFKTLYKYKNPEEAHWPADYEKAEYRQVFLGTPDPPPTDGRYQVECRHGYWIEEDAKAKHHERLFCAAYETWAEAEISCKEQLQHCVDLGFVHAFYVDYLDLKIVYEDLSTKETEKA